MVFLGLLMPLIFTALLADKKESTTIVPDPVVVEHLSQDLLEAVRGQNITALQDHWLEVEKGLNNTAIQLDLKRAWFAKAIRQFNKKLNNTNHS